MTFIDYWRDVRAQLDREFVHWVWEFFRNHPADQIETIYDLLKDGKRIRGCLVCLVNNALGGKIQDAIPRAMAIECIQAASLIHDDYVDGDTVRRNRSATWTVEGPRKAVLLGDVIFATAIQRMMELSPLDGLVVAQAIATTANGAYLEFSDTLELTQAAGVRYSPELYNRIIHLKTGALFGAASSLGAAAAGASSEMGALAFRFGARLGEAYQIADDLCDFITLKAHSEDLPTKISLLAPLILYFAQDQKADFFVSYPLKGKEEDFQEWFKNARPVLQTRMEHEIAARLDLAAKEIRGFPDNFYTQMLRAAPSEIVRMMLTKVPLSIATHSK